MVVRKLLWPTLKRYFRLFLAMVITSGLGIAIMIGLWGVYSNLKTGVYGFKEDYQLADAVIQTRLSSKSIDGLEVVDSIDEYNTRLVLDCTMLSGEDKLTARVFTYKDDDFQKFCILEEKKSDTLPNIRMDSNFAERNNLHVGDTLTLYYYNVDLEVCLGEIVTTPECMSVEQNRFIHAETSGFGYVYINEEITNSINIFHFYNQILLRTRDGYTDEEALEGALEALPSNLKVIDSYTYENSSVGVSIDMNLLSLKNLFTMVPPLFFGITLLIVFLFMVQIMKQERKSAGILKALGYESRDILLLYLVIAVIVSLISAGIGIAVGYPIEFFVNKIYLANFGVPYFRAKLDVPVVILAVFANMLVTMLAALISAREIYRTEPGEAMTAQVSDAREPLPKPFRHLPVPLKLSVSMIARNTKRFILSTVCVMASIMMIIAALMFYHSGNCIKSQTFNQRFCSDAMVFYSSKLSDKQKNEIAEMEFVTEFESFEVANTEISYLGKSTEITLFGLEDTKLHQIPDSTGFSVMELPEYGIVLSKTAAKAIGAKKGDVIRLNGKPVEVTGISYQNISPLCYMPVSDYENYDLTSMGGFFCNDTDDTLLTETAAEMSNYSCICFTDQMKTYVYDNFKLIYIGVYIIIAFAVILGFVIVLNVSQITFSEEKRELAVMRTLGVRMNYISGSWMMESLIQFILASIFGNILGLGLAYVILYRMSSKNYVYSFDPKGILLFLTCAIVFLFMALSHIIIMRLIRRLDLVESTKSKE